MKKRFVLVTLCILAAAVAASCLMGCKKSGESVDYAGVYTISRAEVGTVSMDGEMITQAFPPDQYYIEIIDSVNIRFVLGSDAIDTTYVKEGNTLRVDDGNATLDFVLQGNEISYYIASEDATLFFTK